MIGAEVKHAGQREREPWLPRASVIDSNCLVDLFVNLLSAPNFMRSKPATKTRQFQIVVEAAREYLISLRITDKRCGQAAHARLIRAVQKGANKIRAITDRQSEDSHYGDPKRETSHLSGQHAAGQLCAARPEKTQSDII